MINGDGEQNRQQHEIVALLIAVLPSRIFPSGQVRIEVHLRGQPQEVAVLYFQVNIGGIASGKMEGKIWGLPKNIAQYPLPERDIDACAAHQLPIAVAVVRECFYYRAFVKQQHALCPTARIEYPEPYQIVGIRSIIQIFFLQMKIWLEMWVGPLGGRLGKKGRVGRISEVGGNRDFFSGKKRQNLSPALGHAAKRKE